MHCWCGGDISRLHKDCWAGPLCTWDGPLSIWAGPLSIWAGPLSKLEFVIFAVCFTRANFDRDMFTFTQSGAQGSECACANVTLNFGLVPVPFCLVSFRFTVSVPGFIACPQEKILFCYIYLCMQQFCSACLHLLVPPVSRVAINSGPEDQGPGTRGPEDSVSITSFEQLRGKYAIATIHQH